VIAVDKKHKGREQPDDKKPAVRYALSKTFPGMVRGTADPSAAPDFLSSLVAPHTPCGFPYRKPHTLLSPVSRTGNPGTLGGCDFFGALY
jgi:hypothetical protein